MPADKRNLLCGRGSRRAACSPFFTPDIHRSAADTGDTPRDAVSDMGQNGSAGHGRERRAASGTTSAREGLRPMTVPRTEPQSALQRIDLEATLGKGPQRGVVLGERGEDGTLHALLTTAAEQFVAQGWRNTMAAKLRIGVSFEQIHRCGRQWEFAFQIGDPGRATDDDPHGTDQSLVQAGDQAAMFRRTARHRAQEESVSRPWRRRQRRDSAPPDS